MKRSGFIILALGCLLQSGGLMLIYKLQQSFVRIEMQNKVEEMVRDDDERERDVEFETRTISLAYYNESRVDEREVLLEGKMYDVASKTIIGDSIQLYMLHDEHETRLVKQMNALADESPFDTSEQSGKIFKLLRTTIDDPISASFDRFADDHKNYLILPDAQTRNAFHLILSPPPDLV